MSKSSDPIIGIIGGKGRMGALFAEFFTEQRLKVLISDLGTKLKNPELASKSDIVIISVPIDKTEKVIKEALPYMKPTSAIMDFTSIKTLTVTAMLKGKVEVLGLHPMFGNSNPIPGQTVIICPTKKSGKWSVWLENFLRQNNVKIEKMSAQEHDKIMNIAQGLIHFAEITFADGLRRCGMPISKLLNFTGKASELKVQLAARIIDQDAGLYGNIQIANPYALKSLKAYKQSIDELLKIVQEKNLKAFENYFTKNKKFLGNYTKKAYEESSYLIDKLLEFKKTKTIAKHPLRTKTSTTKPSTKHLAVLGPKNTFSDLAADKYLAQNQIKTHDKTAPLKKYFAHDIDEIFELVEQGRVAEGIVPIENKLHGSVRETLDGLFYKKVHISTEVNIPIRHCLIILGTAKKSDIKTIMSHSQALNQCKKYLHNNFDKSTKLDTPSTAAAIEKLLNTSDKSLAVIAPEQAATNNPNLKILAGNIEDESDNNTSFVVLHAGELLADSGTSAHADLHASSTPHTSTFSRADSHTNSITSTPNHTPKTSVAFHFSKDAPGSLFQVFQDFAAAKINLTKIESRPTKAQLGDYIFYLDFQGHLTDPNIQKTLKLIAKKVARLKILGSYYFTTSI